MSERHRTISGREAMRCGAMVAASASVVAPIDSAQSETAEYAELRAAQGAANSKPGPRTVPAKVITAPGGLDPATAALVAAPYSPLWNLTAPDDAGWRAIVKKASDAALPTLATARAALAVTVEPIKVGGVNAFILTPKEIPAAHTNQLVVNLHGGGWIFGAGESGTAEAMQLAAIGGYKVLAIDYRMPPDAPYPAATDDVTAAWRALSPIYGDFHGFPPAILMTGTRDLLLSDTVRAHRKLRRASVTADLHVLEGLSHAQHLYDPTLTVPKEVFDEIARFFDAHLAK
jgi:acetyl esterase/lipase